LIHRETIRRAIEQLMPSAAEFLSKLISFPSTSGKEHELMCWAEEAFKELGVEVLPMYGGQSFQQQLKVLKRAAASTTPAPPWLGSPPDLAVYRQRGHRRLDARIYQSKCRTCLWGCRMPVEIIVDQWNPSSRRYRFETFCYGPKSCAFYKAGPTRKVPGRRGMVWEEEDWVDQEATAHREGEE